MPLPNVTVMIPVLNEERHLAEVVAAALAQDYQGAIDVVLAIGPSKDRTQAIAEELAAADARVSWVANPSGRTPDALNAALARATGSVIVRCDGHAILPADYVATAVAALSSTGAVNVGGIMDAQGETHFQKAVAYAMRSKFGVGSAAFHVGGTAGPAETVYLGCFDAQALRAAGGYDSKMTRAQDWELNHRLIEAGGLVWFEPKLRVTYRPRRTIRTLAKQYLQYGQWRRRVMRMHPETSRRLSALRYFAPPLALAGIALGSAAGLAGLLLANALTLGFAIPAAYLLALCLVAVPAVKSEGLHVASRLPAVLATMHLSWGWGFLTSRVG